MQESNLLHEVSLLVIQLAIIIIGSWAARRFASRIKLPAVVAYIILGVILGPYILGSLPVGQLFHDGIFPKVLDAQITVSPYLYSFAAIASILLLFVSGLEIDMMLFIKYSLSGSIVGFGGLIFSFAGGYLASFFFLDAHLLHPMHLFMGTIATATSVGITTTVLSEQSAINSPEGLTVLSAAVLDDVLGIILLAIIVATAQQLTQGGQQFSGNSELWLELGLIALKAIAIWLGSTILGLVFSRRIGKGIKAIFRDSTNIAVVSFGLALLLGGIFEALGLSMVIGAYILGLSLSNTDLAYVIQEKIKPISTLFTPIFFIVTGMMINLNEIFRWETFLFGLSYAVLALLSKLLGCGLPALALGFNRLGALRIGMGMAPRGEIALHQTQP